MCETESLFVFLCLSCFVNSLFFSHFHTRIKRRIVQLQLTRRKVKDGIREDFRKQPLTCDAQTQWSQKPPFWSKHPIYSSKCLGCRCRWWLWQDQRGRWQCCALTSTVKGESSWLESHSRPAAHLIMATHTLDTASERRDVTWLNQNAQRNDVTSWLNKENTLCK